MLTQCHAVWNRSHWVLIALGPLILCEVVVMSISSFTKIVGKRPLFDYRNDEPES